MSDMQQIEVAIGQRDTLTGATPLVYAPAQCIAAQDFVLQIQFRAFSY